MIEPITNLRPLIESDWAPIRECTWQIADDEVHLWRIKLADGQPIEDAGLSKDEIQRASRFRRDIDRQRFVTRRLALRQLLSKYVQTEAQAIGYRLNEFGKPTAVDADGHSLLPFSSSSRDHIALIAFGQRELGVDIENTNRRVKVDSVVSHFFHPQETVDIQECRGQNRVDCFFHCWTRKEAYIKAVGRGLHLPLNSFRVSVTPDRAELLWRDDSVGDTTDWLVRPIGPAAGYVGALVQDRGSSKIFCYDYD